MPITLLDILTFQVQKEITLTLDGHLALQGIAPEKFKVMLAKTIHEASCLQQLVLMNDISPDIAQTAINALNYDQVGVVLVLRGNRFSLATALTVCDLLKTNPSIRQVYLQELSEELQYFFSVVFSDLPSSFHCKWIKSTSDNSKHGILYVAHWEEASTNNNSHQALMQAEKTIAEQEAVIQMQEQTIKMQEQSIATLLANQDYILQLIPGFLSPTDENLSESNGVASNAPRPQQNQNVKRCKSTHADGEPEQTMGTQHLATNSIPPSVTVKAAPNHKQSYFFVNPAQIALTKVELATLQQSGFYNKHALFKS